MSAQEKRFAWLSAENQDLRTRLENVERDRSTVADELVIAREANAAHRRELDVIVGERANDGPIEPERPNRAQRRRAAKDSRRRS